MHLSSIIKHSLYILVAATVLASCKKENTVLSGNNKSAYLPLAIGKSISYHVDSTVWDDINSVKTTVTYDLKYVMADTFSDNMKRLTYRVDIYRRANGNSNWKANNVMYITDADSSVEWFEDNVRFVKMVFPVTENYTWDGNSKVNLADPDLYYLNGWVYKFTNVAKPFSNGYAGYGDAVIVKQIDYHLNDLNTPGVSFVEKTYAQEVFAKNVGLVYRELTHYVKNGALAFPKGYSLKIAAYENN
ncbi:MAG: hypothetical protein ACKOXV_03480 [Bacteroidota bacterium]|jgi:hypothetical protein